MTASISVYFSYFSAAAAGLVIIFLLVRLRKIQAEYRDSLQELDRYKLTLEISEDVGRFGTWQFESSADTVKWSDYVFDMHERRHSSGYPALEKAINYYHPEDRPMVDAAVSAALEQGEDFEFRARIITEKGNELPVLARGTCQIARDGAVRGIFGCFVDLSLPEDRR